jgi:hypothetical protein
MTPRSCTDVSIALSPTDAYRRRLQAESEATWMRALERPALVTLLVGVSVAIVAAGHASPALVVSTTLSWSWVVLVQVAIALAMTRARRPAPAISAARRFELWFAGHVPWTVWLLIVVLLRRLVPDLPLEGLIASMLVPMAWTARIAAAFVRVVLGRSAGEAWARAALHQAALVAVILSYIAWAAGGWFRLVG